MSNFTNNAKQTKKLGEKIAKEILKSGPKNTAVVLILSGDLGSGKTTFLQGFAKGLGIKEKILSPTFVIQKRFSAKGGPASGWKNFYHFDCYRLSSYRDILELGWEQIISNPKNIVAVEWPKKIKKLLPKNTICINFKFINENTREIVLLCCQC